VDIQDLSRQAWDAIGRSVVARSSPRVCVPITGGLDSRTVAGALRCFTPETVVLTDTIGPPSCIDVQYGRRIARQLGFPHRHEELDSDYISRYGPEVVRVLGGSAGCYTGWVLAQNHVLSDFGRPVVMTGFLGDCLSGGHLPVAMADSNSNDDVLNHLYARSYETVFSAEALKRLLRPELVSRMQGSARETIARTFREANAESPLHRCDYVDLVQRQRRFICTHIALHQPVAPVRDPFTDARVVDFFLRLPLTIRLRQDLYISMIKRFLPELARLPRSSDGLPLTASRPRRHLHVLQDRMRKRILKTRRVLGLQGESPALSRACFDYGANLRAGSREYVTRLLADSRFLPEVVRTAEVDSLLATHLSGSKNLYRQVSALATLAEAFRQFVE
ncbi:MAG: hypothetical protein H6Q28_1409, partial [Bacteroidetes bacterium]|nr:hypothetical protein [Bacteroidota bacterium]